MKIYNLKSDHEKKIHLLNREIREINLENKKKLGLAKKSIDSLNNKLWEQGKKKMNDYEYIYTSSKIEKNICSIIPVSRSFFKLHEIIKDFNMFDEKYPCACIAEGPGGFIHCLNNNNSKKVYAITLISRNNRRVPYWNQTIINNKNNILSYGIDKTGDIYKLQNVDHFIELIGKDYCHLITADGGFDYSNDYNSQESLSYKLLYCEIFTALNIQKNDGNFIIKFFDLFNYNTIQLIYILYTCYDKIIIYKPLTSRLSNSEKYILCIGYNGCSRNIIQLMRDNYSNPEKLLLDIPPSFIEEISSYNNIYTYSQCSCINNIIQMVKSDKLTDDKPRKEQINLAKKWCELYNLPINRKCIYLN